VGDENAGAAASVVSAPDETAPAPAANAAVWACKLALSDTASAVSNARKQNDFNMGKWGDDMGKNNREVDTNNDAGTVTKINKIELS
jgi:hypothetical protein